MTEESGSSLDRDANYLDCFRGFPQSLQANVKVQGVQLMCMSVMCMSVMCLSVMCLSVMCVSVISKLQQLGCLD